MSINVNTSLAGRTLPSAGLFLETADHFDPFIVKYERKRPVVIRDMIKRGTQALFNGYSQKFNIWRGTLGVQQGLNTWNRIQPSVASTQIDNCAYNPSTYTWGTESMETFGLKDSFRSPVFCVEDLMYTTAAREQLSYIIQGGVQYMASVKENFAREMYANFASNAGKLAIMCDGGLKFLTDSSVRFSYNPFVVNAAGNTYITFNQEIMGSMSALNWEYLEYIYQYLQNQAPEAAHANINGMPHYLTLLDMQDFSRMIRKDSELREDMRYAKPGLLIEGYPIQMTPFRGGIPYNDLNQYRFKIKSTDGTTVTAERVVPEQATRAGDIGYIPEANPDYISAELGAVILMLDDVYSIQVPPTVTNLGSGLTFGPAPGFNGDWKFINNPDNALNPLGQTGYFFSRYAYFPKPGLQAQNAIMVLYRRCPQALSKPCEVNSDTDAASVASVAADAVTADYDETDNTVTLQLTKRLTAGLGDAVTILKAGGVSYTAYVAEDSMAPIYTFVWVESVTGYPSAYTDFTAAVTTVTVA